jgi:hypothetical protein
VIVEFVPFFKRDAGVAAPSFVRTIDYVLDFISIVSEIVHPRVMVGMMVSEKEAFDRLGSRQQVTVLAYFLAVYKKCSGVGDNDGGVCTPHVKKM